MDTNAKPTHDSHMCASRVTVLDRETRLSESVSSVLRLLRPPEILSTAAAARIHGRTVMMSKVSPSVLAFASLATALSACSDDRGGGGDPPPLRNIEAQSALLTANANLRSILTGTVRASAFARDSGILGDLFSNGEVRCDTKSAGDTTCSSTEGGSTDEDEAAEVADEIADRILNVANVETAEATRIVLKLSPERVCANDSTSSGGESAPRPPSGSSGSEGFAAPPPSDPDPTAPEPPPTVDEECVRTLTQVPIRLAITSRAEGDIDLSVLVGDLRVNPINVSLYDDEISAEIDLSAAKEALSSLLEAAGEDAADLPSAISGRAQLALEKNGENEYTASISILSAIDIASGTGDSAFRITIAQAAPLHTLHIDGNARLLTSEASWRAVDLELPLDALFGSEDAPSSCVAGPDGRTTCTTPPPAQPVRGMVGVHVPGFTGTALVDGNTDAIGISGLGLGSETLRVTIDGEPLFGLDLNPTTGRRLDLVLNPGTTGEGVTLRVKPQLDLVAALDFANIADRIEDVPSWALDEELEVKLDGAAEPEIQIDDMELGFDDDETSSPPPGNTTTMSTPDVIARVLAGRFSIRSRALARSVVVSAGECLIAAGSNASESGNAHPVESLEAGVCPAP